MPEITGTVEQIKAAPRIPLFNAPDTSALYIVLNDQATNTKKTFILWSRTVREVTPIAVWITEVSSLSLLRDAMINKLPVTIVTASEVTNRISAVRVPSDSG